jgi:hypothetical protein
MGRSQTSTIGCLYHTKNRCKWEVYFFAIGLRRSGVGAPPGSVLPTFMVFRPVASHADLDNRNVSSLS